MRTPLLFSILLIALCSCRDDFEFNIPPERAHEYNLLGELKPQDVVSIQLLESVPIGAELRNIDRRDAKAIFRGDDVPNGEIEMAFNNTSEKYHLINEDFRVSEGMEYEVSIVVPDENMDTIVANTRIPKSIGFSTQILSTEKVPLDNTHSEHFVDVVLTLDDPIELPAYYHFVPNRLISKIVISPSGKVDVSDGPDLSLLDIDEVLNNQNAIERFSHLPGIIIEEARMSSSQIRVRLKTNDLEPLKDGPNASATEGVDALNRLNLELHTWSPELYEYHKWVDGRLSNQGSNLPTAARDISNISQASGVFGGASRRIDTPRIQG